MTRRIALAILAMTSAVGRFVTAQGKKGPEVRAFDGMNKYTAIEIDFDSFMQKEILDACALRATWKGETVEVTMDELFEALRQGR